MAVAFIGGTLVPVIICLLLIYVAFYRDRNDDERIRKYSDRTWHNRSTKSLHSSISDPEKNFDYDNLLNPISKRRLYDGTYRTREPIKGKPLVDFTDKNDNLQDVSKSDLDKFKNIITFSESGLIPEIRTSVPVSPSNSSKTENKSSERSKSDDEESSSIIEQSKNPNVSYNELSSESYEDTDYEVPVNKNLQNIFNNRSNTGLEKAFARRSGSSKSSASYKSATTTGGITDYSEIKESKHYTSSSTDSDRHIEKTADDKTFSARNKKNKIYTTRPTSVVQTAI